MPDRTPPAQSGKGNDNRPAVWTGLQALVEGAMLAAVDRDHAMARRDGDKFTCAGVVGLSEARIGL